MNPLKAIKANRHTTCEVLIHGQPFVFRLRRVTSASLIGSSQMRLLAELPPEVIEKMVTGQDMPEGEVARQIMHRMKQMSPAYLAEMAEDRRKAADDMLIAGVVALKSPGDADWCDVQLVQTEEDEKTDRHMALTTLDEIARTVLLEAVQSHSQGAAAKAAASFRSDEPGRPGDAGHADDAVSGAGDDGARVAG
jgi:hypothetical protein|uniref:Uncharacterized protein n=1 Tax=uncultured marine virus TaxID=186617 RepID=A0A0F7L5Z6_9VIRU|nr:hypothetical protein [uncultured marine virus]